MLTCPPIIRLLNQLHNSIEDLCLFAFVSYLWRPLPTPTSVFCCILRCSTPHASWAWWPYSRVQSETLRLGQGLQAQILFYPWTSTDRLPLMKGKNELPRYYPRSRLWR